MGGNESSFKRNYGETVSQLSTVQLRQITTHFHEVYAKAGGSKGHLVDREAFSQYFKLPVPVGERLFEAFDAHKNGKISFEEFVCGLAVLLHGSFSNKCQLLFQVFNIHGDEGISREELATMLHAILQSTNTIVMAVSQMGGGGGGRGGSAVMEGENREQAIRAMVDSAFRNCDITGTGKLLPLEFEYWVRRHPQILDTLLSFQSRESRGTLGPLLLSPKEDHFTSNPTVSVPLHPSPLPPLSSSPLPPSATSTSLEVTHSSHVIRAIRSEPIFVTTETDKQIQPPLVPDAKTSEPLISVEAKDSTVPVAIEIGASSPTLVLEPDYPIETDTGHDNKLYEQHRVKFTTGDEEEEGERVLGEVEVGEMQEDELGGKGGEGEEDLIVGEGRDGEGEAVGDEGSVPLDLVEGLQEDSVCGVVVEGGGGGGGGIQAGSIMQSMETITGMNFDLPDAPPQSHSSTPMSPLLPTTMETVSLGTQDVIEEEEVVIGGEEMGDSLQLPEELCAVGGTPLQLNEPAKTEEEEEMNTVGGLQLEQGGHQLELNAIQSQDSGGDGVYLLDVREAGVGPPFTTPLPSPVVELSSLSSAIPTHLSDPLISLPPPSPQLPPSHPHDEAKEESQTLGRGGGDIGPEPRVLPSVPSPYPDEVAGVKEALYSAWIPSPWTLDLLSRQTPVDQSHLTCPGLVADIKMHDPIAELLVAHFPSESRKTLPSVESVPMDMVGLRRLVKEGCYHAALELTGRFLSAHGQGLGQARQPSLHTHKTLQMWGARLALLVVMQQFREAEVEMEAFGELLNPDLYYQYHTHNYPNKTGSMVPFSMRLLHAQLPGFTGNHQLSLDRLCQLQYTCQQVLSGVRRGYLPFSPEPLTTEDQQVADSLWLERLTRVKFCLANTLVSMQDYLLAVEVYESLLDQLPRLRSQLLSVMGRLHLTLGDLPSAQSLFSLAATSPGSSGEEDSEEGEEKEKERIVRSHINQGLVNVFLCRWQLAKDCFESALQLEPTNMTLKNNVAVCTFYQGHLKECIRELEGVVRWNPPSSLQPALLTNLTATYDLESSSAHSKKLSFLPLLGQHVGEGFPLSSLGLR